MAARAHGHYEDAASELLRALRGKRSQVAFARRLGYRSNPSTDWEHGRRYPTAPEALRVAARMGFDVAAAFVPFAPAPPPTAKASYAVHAWLHSLRGTTRNVELARRAGRSRFSISRWLAGESTPRLPDFLRLLDAINGRTAEWVAALVPIERVPSLAATHRQVSAARAIAEGLPWSEAVLRVVETVGYEALPAHSDAYIAHLLGLPPPDVAHIIHALASAGVIERTARRYRVAAALVVDTKAPPRPLNPGQHWAQVALERLRRGEPDWFAYNVISVSHADSERIERVLRAAYREVRGIVKDSAPCEQAALLTMQLVRWRERA
jgi:transcriptional regulator with XRE-family HTH domain